MSLPVVTLTHSLTHSEVSMINCHRFQDASPILIRKHIFILFLCTEQLVYIVNYSLLKMNKTARPFIYFCLETLSFFCNLIYWWCWELTWFSGISLTEEIKPNSWGIALLSQFVPNHQGTRAAGQLITHPWFSTNSPLKHSLINPRCKSQPYQVFRSRLSNAVELNFINVACQCELCFIKYSGFVLRCSSPSPVSHHGIKKGRKSV